MVIRGYALAGAVLLALVAGLWGWGSHQRAERLAAERDAAKARVTQLEATVGDNEAAFDQVGERLAECIAAREDEAARNAAALAHLRGQLATTASDLSDWMARYDAATRSPDCSAVMAAELCPALRDY